MQEGWLYRVKDRMVDSQVNSPQKSPTRVPRPVWVAALILVVAGAVVFAEHRLRRELPSSDSAAKRGAAQNGNQPGSMKIPAQGSPIPSDAGAPRLPLQTPRPNAEASLASPVGYDEPPVTKAISLHRFDVAALHAALERSLRRRLPILPTDNAGAIGRPAGGLESNPFKFLLQAAPGAEVEVVGAGSEIQLTGRRGLVAAWSRVIDALDNGPRNAEETTQLVATLDKDR
jgi:hypothetical protein